MNGAFGLATQSTNNVYCMNRVIIDDSPAPLIINRLLDWKMQEMNTNILFYCIKSAPPVVVTTLQAN